MISNNTVTFYDNSRYLESLKKVSCTIPFNSFHINPDGNVANCCFYWMPTYIGNITEKTLLQLIEDKISTEAKKSVKDGSYKFCDPKICPSLTEYLHLDKTVAPLVSMDEIEKLNTKKIIIFLDYDVSCNLYCGSCRNERIMHSAGKAPAKLLQIHECVMTQMKELLALGYELTVQVTSSGDGFASHFYWNFLKDIKAEENFRVRFTTNGVLMTREKLSHAYAAKVDHIEISVDAATEETYNKVRRGGSFKAVVKNLNNLDLMVQNGELPNLHNWKMNFVVQADNFREMADFARWALSYKRLNRVWYLLIYDWGHLTKEEFNQKAIWHTDHPEHQEFLEVLRNPIFDDPRIQIGNLGALRKKSLLQAAV